MEQQNHLWDSEHPKSAFNHDSFLFSSHVDFALSLADSFYVYARNFVIAILII